jgi:hypothetical protein
VLRTDSAQEHLVHADDLLRVLDQLGPAVPETATSRRPQGKGVSRKEKPSYP